MAEWKPLTDYIYYTGEGLYSQKINAMHICMANEDTLFIVGKESHTYIIDEIEYTDSDNLDTVYRYDVPTNTLHKYNDTLRETIENYIASIDTEYVSDITLAGIGKAWICTNGIFPIVIADIELSNGRYTYLVYRVQEATCTLLYSPFTDGDYLVRYISSDYIAEYPRLIVVHKEGGLNIGTVVFAWPNYENYINTAKPIYDYTVTGTVKQVPTNFKTSHFITINEFGVSFDNKYTNKDVVLTEEEYRFVATRRYYVRLYLEGEWNGLQGIYSKYEAEQYAGAVYTDSNATLFVYPNTVLDYVERGDIAQLNYQAPMLYSFGHFLFGRFVFGTPGTSPSTSTCKEIQAVSMYENDVYRTVSSVNNSAYLQTLQAISAPPTQVSTYYGSFFVEQTSLSLSFNLSKYNDGSTGQLTFYGPDNIWLNWIDKYYASPYINGGYKRGFFTGNNYKIFMWNTSYSAAYGGGNIYYIPWIPAREAKPTSISTTETSIFIGGSTDHPTVSGVYFADGSPSGETTLSGFAEDPIFVEIELPTTLAGFSNSSDWFEVVSVSGYSYVKNYNEECLLHGKLGIYNALLLSSATWENISSGLPSGIGTSVNFSASMAAYLSMNVGGFGYLYSWPGTGNWTKVNGITTDYVTTAHIISLDDVLLVGHDNDDPEVERTNINLIDVQPSNTNLPSGVYITDIEEDIWNDR